MPTDPYEVLGVARSATAAKIKQAYRKLARKHHPDLHPNDPLAEACFKAISAAHDLLKDPTTRSRFDAGEIDADGVERPTRQSARDFAEGNGRASRETWGFGSPFGERIDPADVFAEILRQRGGGATSSDRSFSAPGRDLRYTLAVPFLDAARGSEMHLTLGEGTDIALKIPSGARDGQILRLRGGGLAKTAGRGAGDQLVDLGIVVPPEIDPDLRDFLTKWRIGHHHDPRAELLNVPAG